MMARGMTIGELARTAGDGVETIRYNERLGLLRRPAPAQGYRRYDEVELRKLHYIRNAKALRLSLKDIAALQQRLPDGEQFCGSVRAMVRARRDEVVQQIAELTLLHADLDAFLDRCARRPPGEPCPVATDLNR